MKTQNNEFVATEKAERKLPRLPAKVEALFKTLDRDRAKESFLLIDQQTDGEVIVSTPNFPYNRDIFFELEQGVVDWDNQEPNKLPKLTGGFLDKWRSRGVKLSYTPFIIMEITSPFTGTVWKRLLEVYSSDNHYEMHFDKYVDYNLSIRIVYFRSGKDIDLIEKYRRNISWKGMANYFPEKYHDNILEGIFEVYREPDILIKGVNRINILTKAINWCNAFKFESDQILTKSLML